MAYSGKELKNEITGQSIRFIQTSDDTEGQLLEMESTYEAMSKEPMAHYHPNQDETFTVLEGELCVRINGSLKQLKKGDSLEIRRNEVHSMWNGSQAKTVVNWQVRPAMDTEYFLETTFGLAKDGKTKPDGFPCLLQSVLLANKYSRTFRLAKPSYPLQRVVFSSLRPISYLAGYRAVYKKYID